MCEWLLLSTIGVVLLLTLQVPVAKHFAVCVAGTRRVKPWRAGPGATWRRPNRLVSITLVNTGVGRGPELRWADMPMLLALLFATSLSPQPPCPTRRADSDTRRRRGEADAAPRLRNVLPQERKRGRATDQVDNAFLKEGGRLIDEGRRGSARPLGPRGGGGEHEQL